MQLYFFQPAKQFIQVLRIRQIKKGKIRHRRHFTYFLLWIVLVLRFAQLQILSVDKQCLFLIWASNCYILIIDNLILIIPGYKAYLLHVTFIVINWKALLLNIGESIWQLLQHHLAVDLSLVQLWVIHWQMLWTCVQLRAMVWWHCLLLMVVVFGFRLTKCWISNIKQAIIVDRWEDLALIVIWPIFVFFKEHWRLWVTSTLRLLMIFA